MLFNYVALTAFAGLASAAPLLAERANNGTRSNSTLPSTLLPSINTPANAVCETRNYTITVTSNNTQFVSNVTSNANETLLTSRLQDFASSLPDSKNFTQKYENGTHQVNGTYYISGTLCKPKNGTASNSTVQLLVHGIGFDSSYWNFGYQPNYSYIEQAAQAGYTTFSYDRLGTGNSSHPQDAYNVVQGATDVAILTKIASELRSGGIGNQSFSKIAGVGHSYGSIQLQALTATAPKAVDAVVLTGFSANTTGTPYYLTSAAYSTATQIFPNRFSNSTLSNAYLVTAAPQTNQLNFFYYPHYAPGAFDLARQTEQPVTQGVLFTFGGLTKPAQSFTGPVHIVTGAQDWIFCLRDCYAVPPGSNKSSILDYAQTLYPKASNFSTYIPANTGHGISAHYSAPAVYAGIQSYLKVALTA